MHTCAHRGACVHKHTCMNVEITIQMRMWAYSCSSYAHMNTRECEYDNNDNSYENVVIINYSKVIMVKVM